MVEPGKEVGHDKKRGLVMPMDVSSGELPGSVGDVASRGRVRCWRAVGSPELFA